MAKKRYTPETIIHKLREAEVIQGQGRTIALVVKQLGITEGNDKFKEEVESLTGQRQYHLKRGPKPKPKSHPKEEFLL